MADRTGHRSSQMIARYRRRARLATELELGWFKPLHEVVPEFREFPLNSQQTLVDESGGQIADKEKPSVAAGFPLVGHEGLEPSTSGLRVRCSTN